MKRIKIKKTWMLSVLCIAVYAVLSLSGLLDKQKIWPVVPVDYLDEKQSFSLSEGDNYGIVTNGPYTELPAGDYCLKWKIEGDGINTIRLKDSNDVEIAPSEFKTVPGTYEGEAYFELKDTVHNFRIETEFCDGTWIAVNNFRLYSPVYRDYYFTVAILMVAAVILMWMYESGKMDQSRREVLILLAVSILFVSAPAMREDTIFIYDVGFHAVRLNNLADGLRSGQFPVRVGGYSYNGYGAVTSVFYPDVLLYPFAWMRHAGASTVYVLNALTVVMNALAALCMYMAAKRIFSDRDAGLYAAILYVCCGFRVDRLYASFMVGQILAMAFLPLFILGLWEIFWGDKSRWMTLTISATLIFQSHMLTTVLCAGIAGITLICFGRKLYRERRVGALLLAILATALLNLTTLVPMVTTYLSGVTTSVMNFGFVNLTREVSDIVGTDKELGLAVILGIAALMCTKKDSIGNARMQMAAMMMALGLLCVWMSTDMFPWKYVMAYTGGIFEILQFPWRFLAISTCMLAMCAGLGYACLLRDMGTKGLLAVLAAAVMCVTPIVETALDTDVLEFGMDVSPYMLTPEYQFEGSDLDVTRSRQVIVDGELELTEYEKDGTRISVKVDAKEDGKVTFPLFGFEGYQVTLNGKAIEWTRGENNRLCVALPAGTSGEVLVRYVGLVIWRIADVVSLLTLAGLGIFGLRKRRMN